MTSTHQPAPRRAAFIFIFITVLLDMLALGIIIPVLPQLVVDFMAGDTARAAEIFGLFGTAWALMQFLFSPLLGALSDRFGRRPVILLSNVWARPRLHPDGARALALVAVRRPRDLRHHGGELLDRLCLCRRRDAARAARRALRHARRRVRRRLRARAGARRPCRQRRSAPAVLDRGGLEPRQRALWLADPAGIAAARTSRMAFAWRRANPLGALKLLRSHRELFGLASMNFLGMLAHAVLPSVWCSTSIYRYGWDERTVGFVLAAVGVCSMVVQGALIGPVVKRFGERTVADRRAAVRRRGILRLRARADRHRCSSPAFRCMALWGIRQRRPRSR